MTSTHPRSPGRLFAIFTGCLLAGCSSDRPTSDGQPQTRPFAGSSVEVVAPAPLNAAERWPLILTEFENDWGARATVRPGGPPAARADSARPTAQLVFLPLTEIAGLERLAPLPRNERDDAPGGGGRLPWSDIFTGLRNNVCSRGGDPLVIPISAPVLVCYFRRDLLEQAGRAPPASWPEYQHLLDTLSEWAPGLTAVEPWGPEYRATLYLARAVGAARHPGQYSLYFDIENGEPRIDTPGFQRGLEQSVQALERMPPEVLSYSPADCRRELLAGRAAIGIAFETEPAAAGFPLGPGGWEDTDASEPGGSGGAAGDRHGFERAEAIAIGIAPLPGAIEVYNHTTGAWEQPRDDGLNRVPLAGFAGLCAGVSADGTLEARRAACKLLARLTVDEFASAFPPEVTTLCRASQTDTPSRWAGEMLTGEEADAYVAAVSESLRSPLLVAEIPVVGREHFRQALTEALDSALIGQQSPADALAATAERWREITAEIGIDAVRNSYRASLGLPPVRP